LAQLDLLYFKRGSTICYIYYSFLYQIEYKISIVCPQTGECLNVAGVEFSTLSQAVLLIKRQTNGIKTHAHLEFITQPIFCHFIKSFLNADFNFPKKKMPSHCFDSCISSTRISAPNTFVVVLWIVYIGAILRAISHKACMFSNENFFVTKRASLMQNRVQNSQM
jgi:hypothetical protein